jgi:SIT family siderophore-iron:H+ symporter-like MFS transporter
MIFFSAVLGIAGGLFPYPVQALVQASTKHEHVAIITALYLTTYQIGSGIGSEYIVQHCTFFFERLS